MDADYHFAAQFTADLIAMNHTDFIITSSFQEIAGTEVHLLCATHVLSGWQDMQSCEWQSAVTERLETAFVARAFCCSAACL